MITCLFLNMKPAGLATFFEKRAWRYRKVPSSFSCECHRVGFHLQIQALIRRNGRGFSDCTSAFRKLSLISNSGPLLPTLCHNNNNQDNDAHIQQLWWVQFAHLIHYDYRLFHLYVTVADSFPMSVRLTYRLQFCQICSPSLVIYS